MCETGFVFSSILVSLLHVSFRREMAQPRLSMATRGLDSQIGGWGKIEGRHILIIAMSELYVNYMNRKVSHSVIM